MTQRFIRFLIRGGIFATLLAFFPTLLGQPTLNGTQSIEAAGADAVIASALCSVIGFVAVAILTPKVLAKCNHFVLVAINDLLCLAAQWLALILTATYVMPELHLMSPGQSTLVPVLFTAVSILTRGLPMSITYRNQRSGLNSFKFVEVKSWLFIIYLESSHQEGHEVTYR